MVTRWLILDSYTLSNRTSTPVTNLWSMVLPSAQRWSPSELRRRAEGWLLQNDQTFIEHGWPATQWRSDETPMFFEFSDRSRIRWKVVTEIGRSSENASKVQNAVWEADAKAMNNFNSGVRLLRPEYELVDRIPGKCPQFRWKSMRSNVTKSTTKDSQTSLKYYHGQNWVRDSDGVMHEHLRFQMMTTAENKRFCYPRAPCDSQKRSA